MTETCCVCLEKPAHDEHRCKLCLRYFKRTGYDRVNLAQNLPRAKPVARDRSRRFDEADVGAPMTFEQWKEVNGYNPKTREYAGA